MSDHAAEPAYRTISDVATLIGVPHHVLRFWESKFPAIAPLKRGGNRRYYRPADVAVIQRIARLLHVEGYTIKGAQNLLGSYESAATAPGPTIAAAANAASNTQVVEIRAALAAGLATARAL